MISKRLDELNSTISQCSYRCQDKELDSYSALLLAQQLFLQTRDCGGIVYVVGNGGSSGLASHFSNDLFKVHQIPSQTLYDSSLLTCLANDFGYEKVFSYPLERLLKKQDLLVAISSSGQSENILNAAHAALKKESHLITFSGFCSQNPLRRLGELNIWINQYDYGLVETAHFFLLHAIIDLWDSIKREENDGKALTGLSSPQNKISTSN